MEIGNVDEVEGVIDFFIDVYGSWPHGLECLFVVCFEDDSEIVEFRMYFCGDCCSEGNDFFVLLKRFSEKFVGVNDRFVCSSYECLDS